jgi:GTP-binding nuclear protein Ran
METKKIVLVGDANVGKTSFVRKLGGKTIFDDETTLGVEVTPIRRSIGENQVCYNIWDCAGVQRFRGLGDGYWVQANCAIIMAECENSRSIFSIENWRTQLQRMIGDKPIIVVFNKCELLTQEQKEVLERDFPNAIFISCKNNINIENVLNKL